MSAKRVILVLGDISGYTKFIRFHGVSLIHAERIISELLESMISAVSPPLALYEVDGDAVTFCAIDEGEEREPAENVLTQVKRCMDAFRQREAELIDEASLCLCDACKAVGKLKLKVVVHRGEATFMQIRQFNKVGGHDIILAHRLLKSDVQSHEYILMTDAFTDACPSACFEGQPYQDRAEHIDGFGVIRSRLIDFERPAEPVPSTLGAKLTMFARLEAYLVKRLLFRKTGAYSSLREL